MSRLILLGVRDAQVDALSRLGTFAGTTEVLVVHPDPDALVLKLARMADLPTFTRPPDPQADDVLVAPEEENSLGEIVDRWREVGAAIRPLSWLAGMEESRVAWSGPEAEPEPEAAQPQPQPPSPEEDRPDAALEEEPGEDAQPEAAGTPTEEEDMPVEMEVPAAAWSSPEATFAYLIQASGGSEATAVLWWDGGKDHWVPWMWTGPEPGGSPPPGDGALELASAWGKFVLEAEGGWVHEVPCTALLRVAEDAAVRDLLLWEREREGIVAAARDLIGPDRTVAMAALEPLLKGLGAVRAFLWQRREGSWMLLAARGEGIRLEGTLILPEALLATTFAPREEDWQEWQPSYDLRLLWQAEATDRRWPLRLARLETALHSGSA